MHVEVREDKRPEPVVTVTDKVSAPAFLLRLGDVESSIRAEVVNQLQILHLRGRGADRQTTCACPPHLLPLIDYLHDDINIVAIRNDIPAALAEDSLLVSEETVGLQQTWEVELILAACDHTSYRSARLLAVLAHLRQPYVTYNPRTHTACKHTPVCDFL